ncbi:hypothetical protein ACRWQM_16275 [Shewanella sp. HL-SH5]|uniref:hypothetical protein n=1 Tax=Shewanella sp. HL-SH5 TaxID=3436241 RepID=UPI003EBB80D8
MKKLLLSILTLSVFAFSFVTTAATPTKNDQGVVEIHLEQHGGHFTARDTLAGLKPGKYQFIIENKTNKLVGFQLQNFITHEQLDMFPLEVGQTKRTDVIEVTEEGIRFRCPINPTPWYDMDGIKG